MMTAVKISRVILYCPTIKGWNAEVYCGRHKIETHPLGTAVTNWAGAFEYAEQRYPGVKIEGGTWRGV